MLRNDDSIETVAGVDELTMLLPRLRLADKIAVSIQKPESDYVLHIDSQTCCACGDSARIAATSSNRSICLYSRHNLACIGTITGHEKAVTGVKFATTSADLVYSASLDGIIRCWDMRANLTKTVSQFEGYDEAHNVFQSFDVSCDDRLLCAGTELDKSGDALMMFWDCRHGDILGAYKESHQDDITQVGFHPSKPDLLLSGSTDGLMCLFDISQDNEEDALLMTFNSESSVGKVGWCGPDRQHAYCITHIETLHIWDTQEYDPVTEVKEARTMFQGDKRVDYLVDCFQLTPDGATLVLAGSKCGRLQVMGIEGSELTPILSLDGGHRDIVRCSSWDQETEMLVSGGEDSMLCLWSAADSQSPEQMREHRPRDKHKAKGSSAVKAKMKTSCCSGAPY